MFMNNIKNEWTVSSLLRAFFQGTQERVRNNRGKRAISVRDIEVLLYFDVTQVIEKVL